MPNASAVSPVVDEKIEATTDRAWLDRAADRSASTATLETDPSCEIDCRHWLACPTDGVDVPHWLETS
jgi:hypothetical protein